MVEIRKAKLSEVRMAVNLIDEFDRVKSPQPSEDRLEKILNDIESLGGCVVGAFSGEILIGTCTVNICPNLSWSGRSFAIIENVIVSENWRNQGIGKAILEFAKQHAMDMGCFKVALTTGSKRTDTFQFYESAGFIGNKTGFQFRSGA